MRSILWPGSEKGQATVEFVIVFPMLIGVFFLALALAAGWHIHHLSASLSLEGSALESLQPGLGVGFILATGERTAPSSNLSTEIAIFPYAWLSGSGVRGQRFTTRGNVYLPWAPFDIYTHALIQGTTYTPIWEFNGAP